MLPFGAVFTTQVLFTHARDWHFPAGAGQLAALFGKTLQHSVQTPPVQQTWPPGQAPSTPLVQQFCSGIHAPPQHLNLGGQPRAPLVQH